LIAYRARSGKSMEIPLPRMKPRGTESPRAKNGGRSKGATKKTNTSQTSRKL